MAKRAQPEDAFVERPIEENTPSRSRRLSLRLNDEGGIDWSQSTDDQKQAFLDAIANDPDALEKMSEVAAGMEGEESSGPVTAEQVKTFLTLYAKGEAYFVPWFIKKQSKGLIRIAPEVAEKFYQFSQEQLDSMAPDGAEFANKELIPNLPDWLKDWLFVIGPGAKFFGALALHTVVGTTGLINYIKQQPRTVDASSATQPVNGKSVEDVA